MHLPSVMESPTGRMRSGTPPPMLWRVTSDSDCKASHVTVLEDGIKIRLKSKRKTRRSTGPSLETDPIA